MRRYKVDELRRAQGSRTHLLQAGCFQIVREEFPLHSCHVA